MSDLISREALIDSLEKEQEFYENNMSSPSFLTALSVVRHMPTVEAVPVVHCKDCKHSDLPAVLTRKYGKAGTLTCHNRYGSCNNRNVNENDFCSAGELPEQI